MTFSPEQVKALSADLERAHVKQRKQSGRALSYVEGWHVIAEANRIFGFDGWASQTVETTCVSKRERKIGTQGDPGWSVTYTAKVRVAVGEVVREGCGAGHGIALDLGQAHESALKEAETDARKRALMTFGNPFGLALYDKDQIHVSDTNGNGKPATNFSQTDADRENADNIIDQMRSAKTEDDMRAVWVQTKHIHDNLPDKERERVVRAGRDRKAFLTAQKEETV